MYTLNGWTVWCVNCILIKLFLKKNYDFIYKNKLNTKQINEQECTKQKATKYVLDNWNSVYI